MWPSRNAQRGGELMAIFGNLVKNVYVKIQETGAQETKDAMADVASKARDLSDIKAEVKITYDSSAWEKLWSQKAGFLSNLPGPFGQLGNLPPPALAAALAGIVTAVGGLAAELGAVTTGFLAAGAGAAAFAGFALPAITQIYDAISGASNPKQLGRPLVRQLYEAIQGVIAEYQTLSAAFSKQIIPQFLPLLITLAQDAKKILPDLIPLAQAAAGAFGALGKAIEGGLGKLLGQQGFLIQVGHRMKEVFEPSALQDAIGKLSQYVGPSIIAIGAGIAKIGEALAGFTEKLFKLFSVKDVVHGLNILFDILAGTITVTGDVLLSLASTTMQWADEVSAAVKSVRNWFDLASQGLRNLKTFGLIEFTSFVSMGISEFDRLRHDVAAEVSDLVSTTAAYFRNLVNETVADWNTLPGKIVSALASLPGMLYSAGQHAVQSLISGLLSQLGSLGSAAASLAKKVAGFFGLSPAVEGPLSGGGSMEIRGRHAAADYARGLAYGTAGVGASAAALASAAIPGSGGGYTELRVTGAGAADWLAIVKLLWPGLKLEVRQVGGGGPHSVQRALGQVWR